MLLLFSSFTNNLNHPLALEFVCAFANSSLRRQGRWDARSGTLGKSNGVQQPLSPSLPVPLDAKTRGERQVDSSGGLIRVIPSTLPREEEGEPVPHQILPQKVEVDIPEEKAMCRICLVELGEGDTLKLECNCKGELAFTHQDCALKWFTIKGSKICEVCKAEVHNIPITPQRDAAHVPSPTVLQTTYRHSGRRGLRLSDLLCWFEFGPNGVTRFNVIGYFCFMAQLLFHDLGPANTMLTSTAFSWPLGHIAFMATTSIVGRRFPWIHALVQFTLVALSSHMLHSLLHLKALASLLFGVLGGFFVAYCMSCVVTVLLKLLEHRRNSQEEIQQQIQTTTA